MTQEQKEIIRKRYANGFLATRDDGIGFIQAIEQSGDGVHVYQRLGKGVAVNLDFEERLLAALKTAHALALLKFGNLDPEVWQELESTRELILEVTAYRAAEMEAIAKCSEEVAT